MSRKALLTCVCFLTIVATAFAEKITMKPSWKVGETKSYALEHYTDTAKTSSSDVAINVLEKTSSKYKISCTYTNEQDFTGMEEMAKAMIGQETYEKIKRFIPIYTTSLNGKILSVDNFNEYRKILDTPQDTSNSFSGKLNGLMALLLKSMTAPNEKSFMDMNMQEILAMHKYFGKEYDTKMDKRGTTNITLCTTVLENVKSSTKVSKEKGKITFVTTAKLPEKECLNAMIAWMKKYMTGIAKEMGVSPDDPKIKEQVDKAVKEFKEQKMTAESKETAVFDAKTGWMISYESVQTLSSTEGNKSETLIVKAK